MIIFYRSWRTIRLFLLILKSGLTLLINFLLIYPISYSSEYVLFQFESAVCSRWMTLNDGSSLKSLKRLADFLMKFSDFIWRHCGKPTVHVIPLYSVN